MGCEGKGADDWKQREEQPPQVELLYGKHRVGNE